jgi:putative transposase
MFTSTDLRRGRTCVFLLHAHLVFVTKYRRVVFDPKILRELKVIFDSVCKDFGCQLIEFDGQDDHVHLLVNYPPKVAISSLVNSLKGVSSRLIRKKKYPSIQKALWGNSLWSPSYFAGSCGGAPLEIVKQYIQQQSLEKD